MSTTIEVERLSTIDLRPGDVIVLELGQDTSSEIIARIGVQLQRAFPTNKAIVVTPGDKLSVMRAEQ